MHMFLAFAAGAAVVGGLAWLRARYFGFRAQRAADYAAGQPELDIREMLSGPIACEGVIFGPAGRVASRFTADMHGSWDGDRGTLTESFRYDSGARQERAWRLTVGADGRIRAEADDIEGAGTGEQAGNSVNLRYRIRLPDSAGGHVLDTTDWMYLVAEGTIINRSQFRKFGIRVGELVATLRKTTP